MATRVDLRVEDHADPLAELERLLALQRAYELAGQADELMAGGRPVEAGALYRRAAELAPESDELLFWAGLALAHSGDEEAGVEAVRRAIAVHPGWATLLERLSPDFAPAGERVREALERAPATAAGFALRANTRKSNRRPGAGVQRSPGSFAGFTDTGLERSSAVRMIRFCSTVWAAG